jgi:hypothetical protein
VQKRFTVHRLQFAVRGWALGSAYLCACVVTPPILLSAICYLLFAEGAGCRFEPPAGCRQRFTVGSSRFAVRGCSAISPTSDR